MARQARLGLVGLAVLAVGLAFVFHGMDNPLGMLVSAIAAGWMIAGAAVLADGAVGALVVSMFALGVSVYLGIHHLDLTSSALCSVNETFDCDTVNRSVYAELRGIPIAFIGAAFYAGVALLATLARGNPAGYPRAGHVVLVGAVGAVAYSGFLAWASTQVGAWCLFCISLYGLNALLLAAAWRWAGASGVPTGEGVKAALLGKNDRSFTVLSVVFVVGVLVARIVGTPPAKTDGSSDGAGGSAPVTASQRDELSKLVQSVAGQVPLDGTEPLLGDPAAPITVVEFADFECPYCGEVAPQLHELVAADPRVRVMFKNFPLSNLCNETMARPMHKDACGAAVAGECARQQGRFWELNRLMFNNQQDLDEAGLSFMAKQVGLDLAAFDACRASPEALDAVKADVTAAIPLNIHGTPSLFVKGVYEGDVWVSIRSPEILTLLLALKDKGEPLPTPSAPTDE